MLGVDPKMVLDHIGVVHDLGVVIQKIEDVFHSAQESSIEVFFGIEKIELFLQDIIGEVLLEEGIQILHENLRVAFSLTKFVFQILKGIQEILVLVANERIYVLHHFIEEVPDLAQDLSLDLQNLLFKVDVDPLDVVQHVLFFVLHF